MTTPLIWGLIERGYESVYTKFILLMSIKLNRLCWCGAAGPALHSAVWKQGQEVQHGNPPDTAGRASDTQGVAGRVWFNQLNANKHHSPLQPSPANPARPTPSLALLFKLLQTSSANCLLSFIALPCQTLSFNAESQPDCQDSSSLTLNIDILLMHTELRGDRDYGCHRSRNGSGFSIWRSQ